MKVFKILNPKRIGTGADSDSEGGFKQKAGHKNIRAMINEIQSIIEFLTSDELLEKIKQAK